VSSVCTNAGLHTQSKLELQIQKLPDQARQNESLGRYCSHAQKNSRAFHGQSAKDGIALFHGASIGGGVHL
jgi:hypothetical protein